MMRQVFAVVLSGMLGLLAACGQPQQPTSELKHDANKPVRNTDTWNWRSVTRDDYKNLMAPVLGIDASNMMAADDPVVQRTQLWLDRVDATVRGLHPDQLVNVPKPQAMVLKSPEPNAFVAPVPVCYNIPVAVANGHATAANTVDKIFLDIKTGDLGQWPKELNCVDADDPSANFADVIERFNAGTTTGCQLSLEGGTLRLSTACQRGDDVANIVHANSFAILETANFVTVFSAIVPLMTEDSFASVLAHELGHYYRSHLTAPDEFYSYFYTMTETGLTQKPAPEPDKKQLGDDAVASSTLLDATEIFTPVSGQQLRSDLFFGVGSFIEKICDGNCPSACKGAKSYMQSTAFETAIAKFPLDSGSAEAGSAYGKFEAKALACFAKITVVGGTSVLTPSTTSWDAFTSIVGSPTWPAWLGKLSDDQQQELAPLNQLTAQRLGTSAPSGSHKLSDAILAASQGFAAQDGQADQVLKQAYAQHLGQYTIEEEADDESAEFISDMGIDPEAEVRAMDSLGAGQADSLDGMLLGQTDCETLWHSHWDNADGSYDFVPIGDYSEIHHSICFRMFNIERDVASHHEAPNPNAQLPAMNGQDWKDVQSAAKAASNGAVASGAGGNVFAELLKASGMTQCTYAYKFL